MMRSTHGLGLLLCVCLAALFPLSVPAQDMDLPSVHAALSFPDPWLVVTPSSLPVYANLLRDAGQDPDAMEERFASDGVVAEGWSEDYSDSYRLMARTDERSQRIFDIARATLSQCNAIAASFTDTKSWQLTSIRYQHAEWKQHATTGRYLLLRYNMMDGDKVTGRGLQFFSIHNGMNYIIDWAPGSERITNRDLAKFESICAGFVLTKELPAPPLPVSLSVPDGLPQETGTGQFRLEGTADPEAGLVLTRLVSDAAPEVLTVGAANRKGEFTLVCELTAEGTYSLALTAMREGYADTTITGELLYKKGLLPVNFTALPPAIHYDDAFVLEGRAPVGTRLQLLDGKGNTPKRVGNNGRFAFTLNTAAPGAYHYTLVVSNDEYMERRIDIDFTREQTEEQAQDALLASAKNVAYARLMADPGKYADALLVYTGSVLDVTVGEGVWFIRVNVSKAKKTVQPIVLRSDVLPEAQPGQRVVCYGQFEQLLTEQDDQAKDISYPTLRLVFLEPAAGE